MIKDALRENFALALERYDGYQFCFLRSIENGPVISQRCLIFKHRKFPVCLKSSHSGCSYLKGYLEKPLASGLLLVKKIIDVKEGDYVAKFFGLLFCFITLSAQAHPLMTVKERLRLHLWTYGLEDKPKVKPMQKVLPEEIERPLRKI